MGLTGKRCETPGAEALAAEVVCRVAALTGSPRCQSPQWDVKMLGDTNTRGGDRAGALSSGAGTFSRRQRSCLSSVKVKKADLDSEGETLSLFSKIPEKGSLEQRQSYFCPQDVKI